MHTEYWSHQETKHFFKIVFITKKDKETIFFTKLHVYGIPMQETSCIDETGFVWSNITLWHLLFLWKYMYITTWWFQPIVKLFKSPNLNVYHCSIALDCGPAGPEFEYSRDFCFMNSDKIDFFSKTEPFFCQALTRNLYL